MIAKISATIRYYIYLDNAAKLLPLLLALSRTHYGTLRRSASDVAAMFAPPTINGFLTIWATDLKFYEEANASGDTSMYPDNKFYVRADHDVLDTLLKIMEGVSHYPPIAGSPDLVNDVVSFDWAIRRLIIAAQDASSEWHTELTV